MSAPDRNALQLAALQAELQELRAQLAEAQETLRAIREGEVDAIIVSGSQGEQVFSLSGAESVYRLIVETMREAALTLTPDGQILFCNRQFAAFVQTPAEQILGRPLAEFVAPDSRELVALLLGRCQTGGAKERVVFQGPEGPAVPAHVSATVLCQVDGLSICIVATDLSELEASTALLRQLRQQQEALQKANDELERRVQERTAELSQAVQRLKQQSAQLRALTAALTLAEERERQRVATVLHDGLQQLLVGMKLVISPLARSEDPKVREAGREVGDLISGSLQCCRSLTEELSPPIARRNGLVPALEWLANWMAEKYQLTVAIQAGEPILVEPNETAVLLFRAIRELLFNAAKHAQVQAATVEIGQREGRVWVCVSDAGVGFDPTQLRMAGGTAGGFGLFSIRERLEYLGGGLEVESAPEKGSRFTLWLPLQQPREATTAAASGGRKFRVLVVDDHHVVRQGLVRLLAEAPDIAVVGEAAEGEAAVTLTRELSPDVVTMDIEMPGMDGVEATRRIHACCPATQVIGLSVHEENARAAAIREAGAVRYITKAAPAEDLMAAIRACYHPNPPSPIAPRLRASRSSAPRPFDSKE